MAKKKEPEEQKLQLLEPKLIYCDSAFFEISPTAEEFSLILSSGGMGLGRFIFNPLHAKRLKLLLDVKISEFEDKHGPLNTKLP